MISRAKKLYALLIFCLFLIPNVYVVVAGKENFPFTCAPMFGYYIGKDTYAHDFIFIAEKQGAEQELIPSYNKTGVSNLWTMRMFFGKVYGSMDESSSFGDHLNDTPAKFSRRMEDFFENYFDLPALQQKDSAGFTRIRLQVERYETNGTYIGKHIIGYYTIATKTFTHTWKE